MGNNKNLILLDLDHTLIYGSYAKVKEGDLLFNYNLYLSVYKRPFTKELLGAVHQIGDIIVYTTALRAYAKKVIKSLEIEALDLFSRKNCMSKNGVFKKTINKDWIEKYDRIIIIDDSPQVWIGTNHPKVFLLVLKEFHGQAEDKELISLIDSLKNIIEKK